MEVYTTRFLTKNVFKREILLFLPNYVTPYAKLK